MSLVDCFHEPYNFLTFKGFLCRYQPPLPADQVKPLNEYEEEGGEWIVWLKITMYIWLLCNELLKFDFMQKTRQWCVEEVEVVEEAGAGVEVLLTVCYADILL